MRQPLSRGPRPPILTGEAHTFGVGLWTPGRRGRGTLTLSETGLDFDPAAGGKRLSIPLAEISEVGVAARLPQARVLVVTYRKNLVLGLTVDDPESWANAVSTLTGIKRQSAAAGAAQLTRFEVRRFRLAVTLLVLVLVVLSTVVPLFYSWMQGKVSRQQAPPHPGEAFG